MNRLLAGLLAGWVLIGPAFADSTINNLGAGTALSGTEQIPMFQGANPAVTTTPSAIKTYINPVTSVATACGTSGGGTGGSITVQGNASANAQTGTTYTLASSDCGKFVTFSNAASIAVTIPIASTSGFGAGYFATLINEGVGTVTLTPTTSTIDGAASLTLTTNQSIDLYSDGTNYFTGRGRTSAITALTGDCTGSGTGSVAVQCPNLGMPAPATGVSNVYATNPVGNNGTLTVITNELYVVPVYLQAGVAYSTVAISITTGNGTGTNAILGLYSIGSGGLPSTLLGSVGISVATSSTTPTGALSYTPTVSGWYYLAYNSTATPVVASNSSVSGNFLGAQLSGGAVNLASCLLGPFAYTGSLPNPGTTGVTYGRGGASACPIIGIK